MEDYFSELKYSDLTEEQRLLVDCIGFEAYTNLVTDYGGSMIYIPTYESAVKRIRDRKIVEDSKNIGFRQLAKKYKLSKNSIIRIISNAKD